MALIYGEFKGVIRMVKKMAFNVAERREGLVAQKLLEVVEFWAPRIRKTSSNAKVKSNIGVEREVIVQSETLSEEEINVQTMATRSRRTSRNPNMQKLDGQVRTQICKLRLSWKGKLIRIRDFKKPNKVALCFNANQIISAAMAPRTRRTSGNPNMQSKIRVEWELIVQNETHLEEEINMKTETHLEGKSNEHSRVQEAQKDAGNVENDMIKESHDRRIKKDAYFVASSDGPGLIITTVQLKKNDKDNNYAEWTKAIHLALRSKKKIGIYK
ncbi:hypothetical protein M9H77_16229 [Catharanthus roseus]|uniref:Uncharacterized protein n=1 Tax=Catharanthus roseus TaxID=4058 RepID=A0ACC0B1A3_CATRO|nr:hypothetical protein M9H77_16229 [Catharanthus roseus]